METTATQLSDEVRDLGLEPYVLELEADGLTVVPPEVTGVSGEFFDRCTDDALAVSAGARVRPRRMADFLQHVWLIATSTPV